MSRPLGVGDTRARRFEVLAYYVAIISLTTLAAILILWEGKWAPLRPGGSMLVLKAVPLLLAFFGVLRGRVYTYQWASMMILAYLAEGLVRAFTDTGLSARLAMIEAVLAALFFAAALAYVRERRRTPDYRAI